MKCTFCGSDNLQDRGTNETKTRKRTFCRDCRHYPSFPLYEFDGIDTYVPKTDSYFKEENDKGEIGLKTKERITTLEQLIRVCEIDTVYWEVERWICNKWEVGAAPRATGQGKNWKRESA